VANDRIEKTPIIAERGSLLAQSCRVVLLHDRQLRKKGRIEETHQFDIPCWCNSDMEIVGGCIQTDRGISEITGRHGESKVICRVMRGPRGRIITRNDLSHEARSHQPPIIFQVVLDLIA